MSDRVLRLTPAEAKRLRRELRGVIERYRNDEPGANPDAPKSAERVVIQIQLFPRLQAGAPS